MGYNFQQPLEVPPVTADSLRTRAAVIAIVLAGALGLAACGDSGEDDSTAAGPKVPGVKLVDEGKLTVCTNLPYPPFQYTEGGKTVGFDVDLVDLVAKRLGVRQAIVDIDFDSIKGGAALNAGRCDLAAAGMTIKEDRKKNLDFSVPYFDEVLALMAPKGTKATSLADVKAQNLPLGVQAATTNLDTAKAAGLEPKEYRDSGKLLLALQSNQVKVVLQDLPVVGTWLKKPEVAARYQLTGKISTGAQYGFAVKKGGNPALLSTINEVLNKSFTDGTWAAAYTKWMGEKPATTPKPG